MATNDDQKDPVLERPRYDLHTASSPPGEAITYKVRTNVDKSDGPFSTWRLYNNFKDITSEEDSWPVENTVLQDWHVYRLLQHCPVDVRKARWPADFDSTGQIRLGRTPRGRAAKAQKDGVWYYGNYKATYQLHGDEGAPKLNHLMRKDYKGAQFDKNTKGILMGQQCRIQEDFVPSREELQYGTKPIRFDKGEQLPPPWTARAVSMEQAKTPVKKGERGPNKHAAKREDTSSELGAPAAKNHARRARGGVSKVKNEVAVPAPTNSDKPSDLSKTFTEAVKPVKMLSRVGNRSEMFDAQEATRQFSSKELANQLFSTREIVNFAVAGYNAIQNAIHDAAAEPYEENANATLTDAVSYASKMATELERRYDMIKRKTLVRLERSGLGKDEVCEQLGKAAQDETEFAENIGESPELPPLKEPEHDWNIKDKLAAMQAKKQEFEAVKKLKVEKEAMKKEENESKEAPIKSLDIANQNSKASDEKDTASKHGEDNVPSKRKAEDELPNDRQGNGVAPVAPIIRGTKESSSDAEIPHANGNGASSDAMTEDKERADSSLLLPSSEQDDEKTIENGKQASTSGEKTAIAEKKKAEAKKLAAHALSEPAVSNGNQKDEERRSRSPNTATSEAMVLVPNGM